MAEKNIKVFTELVKFEKSMHQKYEREMAKKDKSVLELGSKLEKEEADTTVSTKKDAHKLIAKATDKAKTDATKEAKEYQKKRLQLEAKFKKNKNQILKEVINKLFD